MNQVFEGDRRQSVIIKYHQSEISKIFRSNIIDISKDSLTLEMTGDDGKISAFSDMLRPFGIIELIRTGPTALQRGSESI